MIGPTLLRVLPFAVFDNGAPTRRRDGGCRVTPVGLDVNPPKCRNPEVMKSRNANIRHT